MGLHFWLSVVLAAAAPAPPPGLYAIDVTTGAAQSLGAYWHPSIDPAGGYLYADNGQGTLVRWRLDGLEQPREVFAQPQPKTPGYAWPIAAARGGLVAASRLYNAGSRTAPRKRVCLDILTQTGELFRGPLPLFGLRGAYNGGLIASWHPDGEAIAFPLTEGEPRHGLYVFYPRTKNWALAEAYNAQDERRPLPVLRWAPDGRTLSEIWRGMLDLRGGGAYATYNSFRVPGSRHQWLDADNLLLHDPDQGLVICDLEAKRTGTIKGWGGPGAEEYWSLAAVGPHGLAWIGPDPADGKMLQLSYVPKGERTAKAAWRCPSGGLPYGVSESGPVWHPSDPIVFAGVPSTAG